MPTINIGNRHIGADSPTYFIADISANHDGSLERAKQLIRLAAESGADAAKFQNFNAPEIVSQTGFENLKTQMSHQEKWKKSVFEVYQDASIPWEWTEALKQECDQAGIDYFSTPYDIGAVDMLNPFVSVYKIGSGDITWLEMLEKVASMQKPVILATGASNIGDVQLAVKTIRARNSQIVLMQCNTNYTGSLENFRHIHLNVLQTYHTMFPDVILGLSDHTPGPTTTLGAVTLGARVIEKHFTDDTSREGPDHPFSMTPQTWKDMVDRTRELELALGSSEKFIADNELDTVVVQQRSLRASKKLTAGTILTRSDISVLRPAPPGNILPQSINQILGMRVRTDLVEGDDLRWDVLESPTP